MIEERASAKRGLARRKPRSRRRAGSSSSRLPTILVSAFGLLLCIGVVGFFLTPLQFRIVKHLFYALIGLLLLMDSRAALRTARRDVWIWTLVGLMCVSALWSDDPGWAIKRGLVTLQTTTFGLYLALRLSLDDQVRLLSWVFAVAIGVNALYLVVDPQGSFMIYEGKPAFMGILGHKNAIGLLTALALPVFLLRASAPGRSRGLMLLGAAIAVLLAALSRSLTGAGVGLTECTVVALLPLSRRLRRPGILLLPPALFAVGAIAASAGLTDRLLVLLGRDPTLTGRTEIWQHALPVILQRPLLGHSIVSFWQRDIVEQTHVWFSNAHNGFLQLTIDLGIVGLTLLLVEILSTLSRAIREHRRQAGWGAIWPICVASFLLLYNFSEAVLMKENSVVWVLVVAASLGLRRVAATRHRGSGRRGKPGIRSPDARGGRTRARSTALVAPLGARTVPPVS